LRENFLDTLHCNGAEFLNKFFKTKIMLKAEMEKENNTLNKYFIIGLSILVVIVIAVNIVMCFI
jgi:hypothetical protein